MKKKTYHIRVIDRETYGVTKITSSRSYVREFTVRELDKFVNTLSIGHSEIEIIPI